MNTPKTAREYFEDFIRLMNLSPDDLANLKRESKEVTQMVEFIQNIMDETTILLQRELDALRKDKERLDWLSQCTAGEWEELQNVRLSKPSGYLREAIADAIEKEKEKTQ